MIEALVMVSIVVVYGMLALAVMAMVVLASGLFKDRGQSEPDTRLRLYEPARNVSTFRSER